MSTPASEVKKDLKAKAKKAAAKKPAAKPAAPAKKAATSKRKAVQIVAMLGSSLSGPYASEQDALDALSASASGDDTVTLFRQFKSGKVHTKVSLSK